MKRTIIAAALVTAALIPVTGVASAQAASNGVNVRSASLPAVQAKRPAVARTMSPYKFGTVKYSKWFARYYMQRKYHWNDAQFRALVPLWEHESGWGHHAGSVGHAYGIPQSLPGSKMRSAGKDWQNNPETQIKWGLAYIKDVYGSPTRAWSSWQGKRWY